MFRQFSMRLGDLPSTFVNCLCGSDTLRQLCRLSVRIGDFPSTTMSFPCDQNNLRKIFMCLGDLPSISVNILCGHDTLPKIPLTLGAAGRSSINFCQLSVRQRHLTSTFVKFPNSWETFRQTLSTLDAAGNLT